MRLLAGRLYLVDTILRSGVKKIELPLGGFTGKSESEHRKLLLMTERKSGVNFQDGIYRVGPMVLVVQRLEE